MFINQARREFDSQFKLEVARMVVDQGLRVMAVCRSMGVGESAVRRWVKLINRRKAVRSATHTMQENPYRLSRT